MIELIIVCVVLGLLVAGWVALCIEAQGVKEGIKIAIFAPVMIIGMIAAFVYVGYSFTVVFG